MKSNTNERISFNILSCPSSTKDFPEPIMKNRNLSQIQNISQQIKSDKNRRFRFQQPTNAIENHHIEDANSQILRFKLYTSFQEQISRDKDKQIYRRLIQDPNVIQVKPQQIQSLKLINIQRDRVQSMATDSFQNNLKFIENQQLDTRRKQSLNIGESINQNNRPRIQLSFNYNNKIKNQSIQGIQNIIKDQKEIIFNQKTIKRIVLKKLTLKIIVLLMIAVYRLSKKYRSVFLKRNKAIKHFEQLKKHHLNYLNQFSKKQINQLYQNFVEQLFFKIIKLLKIDNQNNNILDKRKELIVDIQKQKLSYFIKLLLQDLELITRKKQVPPLIMHSLNLSLFYGKHTQTSQFVSNRTQFYSKTVHTLNSQQKALIALEYLIFVLIVPNILEIGNKQVYDNPNLQMNFQFYIIAIPVLITVFFTNHFKNLPKISNSNVKPIQLVLNVLDNEDHNPMKTKLIVSSILENDEEMILTGNFKFRFVNTLFNEKPKWKIQMTQLFSKIIKNLELLIDIQNAEQFILYLIVYVKCSFKFYFLARLSKMNVYENTEQTKLQNFSV